MEYTEIIKSRADVACVNSNGGVFPFSSRRFDTILPEWSQAANGLKFPVTKPARLPTPDELPMTRLRNTRLLRFVLMSRLVAVVVISLHPFSTPYIWCHTRVTKAARPTNTQQQDCETFVRIAQPYFTVLRSFLRPDKR